MPRNEIATFVQNLPGGFSVIQDCSRDPIPLFWLYLAPFFEAVIRGDELNLRELAADEFSAA